MPRGDGTGPDGKGPKKENKGWPRRYNERYNEIDPEVRRKRRIERRKQRGLPTDSSDE